VEKTHKNAVEKKSKFNFWQRNSFQKAMEQKFKQ
jgi:hypothetical protein